MGFLAFKAEGIKIVTTPEVLQVLQGVRLKMQSGKSVSSSIDGALMKAGEPFSKALKIWKARIDLGQESSFVLKVLPDLQSTAGRRAFLIILERGLKGSPIDDNLSELEKELYLLAEHSYDKHLQVLPLKMMMPLILLILPGVMLLLIAPLLFTVAQGF